MSEGKKLHALLGQASVILSLFEHEDGTKHLMITQLDGSDDELNDQCRTLVEAFQALLEHHDTGSIRDGKPNDQWHPLMDPPKAPDADR